MLVLLVPGATYAQEVRVYCIDTSGSMRSHGFEDAKKVLIQEIQEAEQGTIIYVINFDINDHLLGRIQIGEDGAIKEKNALIEKVQRLEAKGLYTNLDEPLQAAKALLLEERASGARKIIILSDGLSDPSPGHEKVNLQAIAEEIPERL
jgi:uncharacterized protein with von Willebrand factor type A (vWA) domain